MLCTQKHRKTICISLILSLRNSPGAHRWSWIKGTWIASDIHSTSDSEQHSPPRTFCLQDAEPTTKENPIALKAANCYSHRSFTIIGLHPLHPQVSEVQSCSIKVENSPDTQSVSGHISPNRHFRTWTEVLWATFRASVSLTFSRRNMLSDSKCLPQIFLFSWLNKQPSEKPF